jgi:hypothetical protein
MLQITLLLHKQIQVGRTPVSQVDTPPQQQTTTMVRQTAQPPQRPTLLRIITPLVTTTKTTYLYQQLVLRA